MRLLATFIFCLSLFGAVAETDSPNAFLSTTNSFDIQSKILGETRPIIVSLPDGYGETNAPYPVVYMLDGEQNIRHAIGTADVLTQTGGMPPAILVAIVSVDRDKNYTPSRVEGSVKSGGGPAFLRFLTEELKTLIESKYRTTGFSILEGHSLGGTFAIDTMLTKPDSFDAYVAIAPALWWNNEEQTKKSKALFAGQTDFKKTAYFTIGTDDGDGMRRELASFIDTLPASTETGFRWLHEELAGEGHMSAPLRGHYNAMKFVFADIQTPTILAENFSIEAFLAHERATRAKYGPGAKQSGESYTDLALELFKKDDLQGALAVFKRNGEAYPAWHMNYYYIGVVQQKLGLKAEAKLTFEKALSLAQDHGDEWIGRYNTLIEELSK